MRNSVYGASGYRGTVKKGMEPHAQAADLLLRMEKHYAASDGTKGFQFEAKDFIRYGVCEDLPYEVLKGLSMGWHVQLNTTLFKYRVDMALTNIKGQLVAEKLGRKHEMLDLNKQEVRENYEKATGLKVSSKYYPVSSAPEKLVPKRSRVQRIRPPRRKK